MTLSVRERGLINEALRYYRQCFTFSIPEQNMYERLLERIPRPKPGERD